jgi:hypothetical protein
MRSIRLGVAFVFGFSAAARAQAPLYDFASATPGEALGASVAGLGDVDGDGFGDVAIGARDATGMQAGSGVVRIFSGKTGAMIRELDGERTGDRFGHSVAALGDVDGDLRGDLIVGAPRNEPTGGADRGAIYIYSGASGAQLRKLTGGSDGDQLGWAVTGVPDVNLDGAPDFAFSAPWGDSGGLTDNGIVWVYSGATGTILRSYNGAATADHFGYSIDGMEDVNSDSRGDLVIGAPQADAAGIFDSGRGYLASGAASNSFLATYSGSTSAGWFGHTAASLPDVTGDGRPEAMFGEPFVSVAGVVGSGRVRAYSTGTGAIVRELAGDTQDNLGWVLDGLEDFDGDGKGDILVGVPAAEWSPLTNAGLAKVHSGATGALIAAMTGYYDGEGFGTAVADAGDINLDGFHDAIAGSPSYDLNATDAGRARLILGNAPWPTSYCTGKVNSQGCDPAIGIGGCASVSVGDNLTIVGVNVLPYVNGIMTWSLTSNAAPFYGGTLCVGAPVHRTPVQTSTENVGGAYPCDGVYVYHFGHAEMASAGLAPGMELFAQYWSRDNGYAPPNNIGLTNGVRIEILP